MNKFRKISAKELNYKEKRNLYDKEYWEFRNFAQQLTDHSGKVKKKSDKATHYGRFLIYLVILYEEIFCEEFGDLFTKDALNKYKKIEKFPGFEEFNRENHNFYSATISCFKSFLDYKSLY